MKRVFYLLLALVVLSNVLFSQRIKNQSIKIDNIAQDIVFDTTTLIPLIDASVYEYQYSHGRIKQMPLFIGIKKQKLSIVNNENVSEDIDVFFIFNLEDGFMDLESARKKLNKKEITKDENNYFYIQNEQGCEKYYYKNGEISYQRFYPNSLEFLYKDKADENKLVCMGIININVPAGRFHCWWFESEDGKIREYYSKGIGLIKLEILKDNHKDHSTLLELVKYSLK